MKHALPRGGPSLSVWFALKWLFLLVPLLALPAIFGGSGEDTRMSDGIRGAVDDAAAFRANPEAMANRPTTRFVAEAIGKVYPNGYPAD